MSRRIAILAARLLASNWPGASALGGWLLARLIVHWSRGKTEQEVDYILSSVTQATMADIAKRNDESRKRAEP